MSVTDDPKDPRLTHGADTQPTPMAETYLVLSDAERDRKKYIRPLRNKYVHVGAPGPTHPLQDLTPESIVRYEGVGYVKYEPYDEGEGALGRYWTAEQLANVGKGCGALTRMGDALSETYAVNPTFYGATYCVGCQMHRPVAEFVWDGTDERVGS